MEVLKDHNHAAGLQQEIRLILQTVLGYQLKNGLVPYAWGPSRKTGGDYAWAHWMIALMYAERSGYLAREEAEVRIGRMLQAIDRLPKYHGWLYRGYDMETLKPAHDSFAFQPFYMMSLILVGQIFPSLRPLTDRLLSAYDYSKSYDPMSLSLADYDIATQSRTHPIPLGGPDGRPGAERRLAYVVYSYLTGDIAPWLLPAEPNFQRVGGHRFLEVSKGFNFDICHMHLLLPEIGYYEESWQSFLYGSASHMEREGLDLFPIRSSPLQDGFDGFAFPNIEHHQSMPYLSWYWEQNLPITSWAFVPELGFLRFNDHWRFYWSHGQLPEPADDVPEEVTLEFPQCSHPLCPNPSRITKFRIFAGAASSNARIRVRVNGKKAGALMPTLKSSWLELELDQPVASDNEITLSAEPAGSVKFFRYPHSITPIQGGGRQLPGIAAEVLCEGPYIHTPGSENSENALVEDTCTALSVRISSRHEYYLWQELLEDRQFTRTLVNWVGSYHQTAAIGEVVYNVSDHPVRVEYLRKPEWTDTDRIRVVKARDLELSDDFVRWTAEPREVYRIEYADEAVQRKLPAGL
jgi:hypothetical protein